MAHTCHAAGCGTRTPPEMFMCKRHWFSLPKELQRRVWATYRPGQCDDWGISHEYAETAKEAVRLVAEKEGVAGPALREALMVYDMLDPGRRIRVTRRGKRVEVKV